MNYLFKNDLVPKNQFHTEHRYLTKLKQQQANSKIYQTLNTGSYLSEFATVRQM
jgi:hypothetical protein